MPHTTPMPPGDELPAPAPASDDLASVEEQEIQALRHEVTGLRAALLSRATIDQARGILVGRYRISPEQAFNVLIRWSQHRNIKLRIIAEALVAVSQDGPDAPEVEPDLRRWLEQQLSRPAAPGSADRLGPPVP